MTRGRPPKNHPAPHSKAEALTNAQAAGLPSIRAADATKIDEPTETRHEESAEGTTTVTPRADEDADGNEGHNEPPEPTNDDEQDDEQDDKQAQSNPVFETGETHPEPPEAPAVPPRPLFPKAKEPPPETNKVQAVKLTLDEPKQTGDDAEQKQAIYDRMKAGH